MRRMIFPARSPARMSKQCQHLRRFLFHLLKFALARRFIGTPAQKPGAVSKPLAAPVIVLHFDDERRTQRFPCGAAIGAPAARAARRSPGEPRRLDELLEL